MQAASSKLSFYCPLVASLDEGEDYYPASSYYILDNRDGIEEMLKMSKRPISEIWQNISAITAESEKKSSMPFGMWMRLMVSCMEGLTVI